MTDQQIRCPDCRSAEVLLLELWTASIEFGPEAHRVIEGQLTIMGEGSLEPGSPTGRYEARCLDCDRVWILRRHVTVKYADIVGASS